MTGIQQSGYEYPFEAMFLPIKDENGEVRKLSVDTKEATIRLKLPWTLSSSPLKNGRRDWREIRQDGIVKDIGMQLAHLDAATAANAVAMIAIFNTAGRLILGALSDKVSRIKLVGCTLAVTAAAALVLSAVPLNYGLFFACVAAIAFCFGGNITVFPAIVSDFFGLKNHTKNYGIVYQGFGIGALSGSFIAAMLGGFKPTFIVIGALCVVAVLIALTIKPPFAGTKEKDVAFKAYKRTA